LLDFSKRRPPFPARSSGLTQRHETAAMPLKRLCVATVSPLAVPRQTCTSARPRLSPVIGESEGTADERFVAEALADLEPPGSQKRSRQ
jgi:hypothetical protein